MKRIDELLHSYGVFVRNLGGGVLLLLAVATVVSGIGFALLTPLEFVTDHIQAITIVAIIYLGCVAYYIFRYRKAEPPEPETPRQVRYPSLLIFSKAVFPVVALAFFTACDDPLKSIPSVYVPSICVASYMHVLVLLAILRRSQDYGVSDGCLAAAYGILYAWTETRIEKVILTVVVIIFTGFRNLQLQSSPGPILPITRKQKEQYTKSREKVPSQFEAGKGGPHKRVTSV